MTALSSEISNFHAQESELSHPMQSQVLIQSSLLNQEQIISFNFLCYLTALLQKKESGKKAPVKSGRRRKAAETPQESVLVSEKETVIENNQKITLPEMISFREMCALIEKGTAQDKLFLNSFKSKLAQVAIPVYGKELYLPIQLLSREEIDKGTGISLSKTEISEVRFQHAFNHLTKLWEKMLEKSKNHHVFSRDNKPVELPEAENNFQDEINRLRGLMNTVVSSGKDFLQKATKPNLNEVISHQLTVQQLLSSIKDGKLTLNLTRHNHDTGLDFEENYDLSMTELINGLNKRQHISLVGMGGLMGGESGNLNLLFDLIEDEENPIRYENGHLYMEVVLSLKEYLSGYKTIMTAHPDPNGGFLKIEFNIPANNEPLHIGSVFKMKGMGFNKEYDLFVKIKDILLPPRQELKDLLV